MHNFLTICQKFVTTTKSLPNREQLGRQSLSALNDSKERRQVRMIEFEAALSLFEEGKWELPGFAANQIFHLMNELKQDTTGHAGF